MRFFTGLKHIVNICLGRLIDFLSRLKSHTETSPPVDVPDEKVGQDSVEILSAHVRRITIEKKAADTRVPVPRCGKTGDAMKPGESVPGTGKRRKTEINTATDNEKAIIALPGIDATHGSGVSHDDAYDGIEMEVRCKVRKIKN